MMVPQDYADEDHAAEDYTDEDHAAEAKARQDAVDSSDCY